ncbi:MAG: DUF3160 domain-containing protein [Salinivirgaceae bacterium]|jgi:hypothetical protein|nr:DUF3160 domain-containing protein [Salinivirgaceae bacterium]
MRNLTLITLLLISIITFAQSQFDAQAYQTFLDANKNMDYNDLVNMHPLKNEYFKGINNGSSINNYSYLDSITEKFDLTADELSIMEQNHFMVSERLSFNDFGNAFYDVFQKDMPVFISSDAILHPLHMSYDAVLLELELFIMEPNILDLCKKLYDKIPSLLVNYTDYPELNTNIEDVDLYTTIAYSLISETLQEPHVVDQAKVDEVWNAINAEQFALMPLFSSEPRNIDFSQFKVRGHYTEGLEAYFRTMMWLGRIEFLLSSSNTASIDNDTKRMTIDAFLLNECMDLANGHQTIDINERIIEYFVGESDNLKPIELKEVLVDLEIETADQLLSNDKLSELLNELNSNSAYQQNILGNILITNPFSSEPTPLPISYKLMGQRFIIDSYILSNLVYDKIIFEDQKIWRPMPDPLDAMFALGNENALPLLKDEIDTYKYGSNIASIRYLIDSYDDDFWNQSYYNGWLNALRQLSSPNDIDNYPIFCKSAAWQHKSLNTQLASWSQLRHDNLLYAKPSYTGGTTCMFPHSYIEPNPDFFETMETITGDMANFFESISDDVEYVEYYQSYFSNFSKTMITLKSLAKKELNKVAFNEEEITFLENMLFEGGGCKAKFSGWYSSLFFVDDDEVKPDFIIADIHTQPTDQGGAFVGNVMHVGTGKINLGVFLSKCPSNGFKPMAYIGPVYSYYEKYTTNFERHTDEEWETLVFDNNIPSRPDWVNIYLADESGKVYEPGRELPSYIYTTVSAPKKSNKALNKLHLLPNPAYDNVFLSFNAVTQQIAEIKLYDNSGKLVKAVQNENIVAGENMLPFSLSDLNKGLYYILITGNDLHLTQKLVKQ